MRKLVLFAASLLSPNASFALAPPQAPVVWTPLTPEEIVNIQDDDLQRHSANANFLDGVEVSQTRFSEAGFNWHLLRFTSVERPIGPLWAVPHDDENAAFDAAIAALKLYGGVAVMVNSGPGSSRTQSGQGTCGGWPAIVSRCDPNRNFAESTPLFSRAYLDQLSSAQPVIALHTNMPGFGSGKGDITILDASAAAKGKIRPRPYGYLGRPGTSALMDYDSYVILPFLAPKIPDADITCRKSLNHAGAHVWHEPVRKSDGSLSNYIALHLPSIRYANMESKRETDLAIAAERHSLMVSAYMAKCLASGD